MQSQIFIDETHSILSSYAGSKEKYQKFLEGRAKYCAAMRDPGLPECGENEFEFTATCAYCGEEHRMRYTVTPLTR